MKKSIFIIFHLLFLVSIILFPGLQGKILAQDGLDSLSESVEKINPVLKFSVSKNNDGSRTLYSAFSFRDKQTKEFVKVEGISLTFLTGIDSVKKIGTFKTDKEGKVKYNLPATFKYERNDSGYIHFGVEFEGSDKFEATSSELDIVDVRIKLSLEMTDSLKTVKVEVSKVISDDKTEPINGETIIVAVERMFSHLKIGEITLEDGEGTFEFPSDIMGDTVGFVTVVAKFDEHEIFGTAFSNERINWGIKTFHHTLYHPRSLWTAVAPIWMIVTLSVMLLGVWGHYIYVIIQLIRLKKIKTKVETNEAKE